jgi:hypothetical protein
MDTLDMAAIDAGIPAHLEQEAHEALEECTEWLKEYMGALMAHEYADAARVEPNILEWAGTVEGRIKSLVGAVRAEVRRIQGLPPIVTRPRDARGRFVKRS